MTHIPAQGYRPIQVALHWIVTGVVAFLFITGDSTTEAYFARLRGDVTNVSGQWLPVHLILGLSVLVAMLWRFQLRWRLGVPQVPVTESRLLRWLANAVHVGLYVDMVMAAITGVLVYFWLPALAGVHEVLTRAIFIILVGSHVAGALWHHFYWRDDVLKRMLKLTRERN